jgi:transposase
MELNLIGELKIMKENGIKPNFSSLQRKYNIDRHTIKKYYNNNGVPQRKKRKNKSMFDPYSDEIELLMGKQHVTKKAVFMFLKNKYKDFPGTYNGFKSYTLTKGIALSKNIEPHLLYETDPGYQLQVDWKEDVKIHLSDETEIVFNVFSATLGYSREHVFVYSSSKDEASFKRCLVESFKRLGGVTSTVLTDNMSAVVSFSGSRRVIHASIRQLFKDLNCELKLCQPHRPETKGKDENANKFVKWIYAYDYTLKTEADLINVIEQVICSQCNNQINSRTGIPPSVLFEKEKEYLKPLPGRVLLDSYLQESFKAKVPSTQLIEYKGNSYSVPSEYINKRVDVQIADNCLYIYCKNILIAKHSITHEKINYIEEHYKVGLKHSVKRNEIDIESFAQSNLDKLKKL